jgi:hypothetical protein
LRRSTEAEIEEGAVAVGGNGPVSRHAEVVVREIGEQRAAAARRMASGAVAFVGVVEDREALGFLRRELSFSSLHEVVLRVEAAELVGLLVGGERLAQVAEGAIGVGDTSAPKIRRKSSA